MRHLWNFKQHSPTDYWVILPQRWTKLPLNSMVIYIFLKFGMVKLFETLQTISNMKMNIFQIKIFDEITLLLFMIYSFIKFKVLVSLPKSFYGLLGMRMHCNWPTDHAIDHSSIGLKRLTIQPVFNEVSLFAFSKGTHGFDITVPKNYLKRNIAWKRKCQFYFSKSNSGVYEKMTRYFLLLNSDAR